MLILTTLSTGSVLATDITFKLGEPGRVSLAIYDRNSGLVRSLLHGQQLQAGNHRIPWDGLDANGLSLPAGQYKWRLLRNNGLMAEYLLNVGANPGWAPYAMWVGSHGTVGAVAVDEKRRLYVGGTSNENCSAFICTSLDGKTLHWQRFQLDSFKGAQRLEARDGKFFVLHQDSWLYILDADNPKKIISKWDLIHPKEERPKTKHGFLPPGHQPNGLAVHTRFIAISHPFHNAIRFHDRTTLAFIREVSVPGVQGIAAMADGTVIAAAGKQVIKITYPKGTPTALIEDANLAAVYVATDEARDELWVAEAKLAHTLRRYKLSTGVQTLMLGTKAGRPFGKFNPLHWRDIKDIKCDGNGGIITVEETPRRVAHFTFEKDQPHQPKLVNQWFGGQQWGNFTATDPVDPAITYANASSFHRARVKMNFANRTWEMESLYDAPSWVTRQEGTNKHDAPFPSLTQHESQWQVMHRHGKVFLVTAGGHSGNRAPAIIRIDTENHRLVPVACAGLIRSSGGEWPAWFTAIKPDVPTKGKIAQTTNYAYAWSDINGDGDLQNSEFTIAKAPGLSNPAHGHIDADWNVTLPAAIAKAKSNQPIGLTLKNLAAKSDAAPLWDWGRATPTKETLPDELCLTGRTMIAGLHRDELGALTAIVQGHGNPVDDRHGDTWPGNLIGVARIVHYDAAGNLKWAAAKHGAVNEIAPGEFQLPKRVLGNGKGCIFFQDRRGRPGQAWTLDGLYAGSFLDRRADDGLPFEYVYKYPLASQGMEMFLPDQIGGCVTCTVDGQILWNPAGRNSAPLYRITGWEDWERQTGEVKIAAQAKSALRNGTGLRGSYFPNRSWTGKPQLSRNDATIRFGNRILSVSDDRSGNDWRLDDMNFSGRWIGKIEPIYTEDYQLVLEFDDGAVAKIWIDGKLLIESQTPTTRAISARVISAPVAMRAGEPREIKIEYASGNSKPHLHFSWQSFTQERRHVPASALTPP